MTTVAAEPPTHKAWTRRRKDLGEFVAGVVFGLQHRLLRDQPDPDAISTLARLRRGIGAEPGSDYTLERYTWVPDRLVGYVPDKGPADTEYAVHDAITLYALHQQSQRQGMHQSGNGLGTAVSRLVDKSAGPEGVRRRFAALGTASNYQEAIYHLRGLITMLRGAEIPLDYGLLADDLLALRTPYGAQRVRAAWGREFFRTRPRGNPTTDADKENGS